MLYTHERTGLDLKKQKQSHSTPHAHKGCATPPWGKHHARSRHFPMHTQHIVILSLHDLPAVQVRAEHQMLKAPHRPRTSSSMYPARNRRTNRRRVHRSGTSRPVQFPPSARLRCAAGSGNRVRSHAIRLTGILETPDTARGCFTPPAARSARTRQHTTALRVLAPPGAGTAEAGFNGPEAALHTVEQAVLSTKRYRTSHPRTAHTGACGSLPIL